MIGYGLMIRSLWEQQEQEFGQCWVEVICEKPNQLHRYGLNITVVLTHCVVGCYGFLVVVYDHFGCDDHRSVMAITVY